MAIRTISQDELDKFGIDETTGRLYFENKEVAIRNGFFLLPFERWIAIVAAAGTFGNFAINGIRWLTGH
jgi:hypothetical protein